ncbi:NrfD/PsrC family molybdoenzyme membrane anchor subunit [Methylobacterium nodulans]|uniref:Polysulphide reductase NrfD n=1 Tax=Methylobacterium nodulans (strain LMG 21967 / CNCM I-2342 / ORS 2060) TaxID=460265 RepID=B8IHH4_METNO|nr:NrfD/PsrC family molybdoenzyme membrane anchor subunit [Methylobacterium nodulans]ACL61637.1 Polysulphide reductase NrfD [Methylobacterium nodulans ORS 2060]
MSADLRAKAPPAHRWIASERASDVAITDAIVNPILIGVGKGWWIALALTLPFVLLTLVAIAWLFWRGVGVWGINTTVVWGVAIANYVWWIGIGNAGTLISSMLLLTRQRWRASINRFAEAMTLFAVAIAGLFPIFHLGRPIYAYWLAPYPNTMGLWPQWRSALVWDFWAIVSYLLFSLLFWYVGLLPDLATMRDRASSRGAQVFYGALALGWRGSARHWRRLETLHTTMAALAVPLVCSVHSIVGLDFAASLMPGWQESIFPPYFVVGAMYSGFAMVVVLAALVRWGLRLQAVITVNHFEVIGRVMLTASLVMGLSYATEWFTAWYGGKPGERGLVAYEVTGDYAALYWAMLACNVVLPQALWLRRLRRSIPAMVVLSIIINAGMWLERILIIWTTLSHGYAASLWRVFHPTFWDWSFLFGPLGLFAFFFLILVRVVPAVSMHEVRQLSHKEAA